MEFTEQILNKPIKREKLAPFSLKMEPPLVKAVVDIEEEIIAIDASMHVDLRDILLKNGSAIQNLWGINLYPDNLPEKLVEFDSMINIRPPQNRSRFIEDEIIREKILTIVKKWIQ